MAERIMIVAALALLAAINFGIATKERLLADGRVLLLELAPVDPRSLMQGDYMALRFALANKVSGTGTNQNGKLVVTADQQGVAVFRRLDDGTPLAQDELLLRYRLRQGRVQIASNAFFFQEGKAGDYAGARYGELRVAGNGEAILTGLRDANLAPIGARTD